jgi:predicted transcriptional regulator
VKWLRRNDLDICADILVAAKNGAKKTHIVYRANLNFRIVKAYLRRLLEIGLLRFSSDNHLFTTTEEGFNFLRRYNDLKTPLGDSNRPTEQTPWLFRNLG